MTDLTFTRSITFTIPGSKGSAGVKVTAFEDGTGGITFTADVLNNGKSTYDLRGLFFNVNNDSKLTGLDYDGASVTAFDTVNVIDLGGGVNMQGAEHPFDVGLAFGTPGVSTIRSTTFSLTNDADNLTLDDIANVTFGARLTSNANSGSSKLIATAPAAPDANNDSYSLYEDGQEGLNTPADTATGTVFQLLANDTDADHNTLNIVAIRNVEHGTVKIVDGNDADSLPGDAVKFTPTTDYAGPASFEYAISDGAGGTDFAHVAINIEAVADKPDFSYQVLAGETTNQLILRVTTAPTDDDHSESIDRIFLSGYEGKVASITSTGQHSTAPEGSAGNATFDPSGQVTQDFIITLNEGVDTNFDLGIAVVAKELSNGDEESASRSLNICLEHKTNDYEKTFSATDQSMWKEGDAYTYSNSWDLGFDKSWVKNSNTTIYDGALGHAYLKGSTDGRIAAYLTPEITFNGGSVDASAPYGINFTTDYNKTTDVMEISSSAWIQPGVTLASTGPGGSFELFLDAYFKANFSAGLDTSLGDATIVDRSYGPWSTTDYSLFSMDSSDVKVEIPITDFLSLTAAWPTISTSNVDGGLADGTYTADGASNNFLQADIDVDKFISDIIWLIATEGSTTGFNPLGEDLNLTLFGIGGKVGYDLFDADISAGLNFEQEFTMAMNGLSAKITYENGTSQDLAIGSDLILHDASSYDLDGDGVEFTVTLDPVATLENSTDLGFNVGYALKALYAYAEYNLGFVNGKYEIGPAWENSNTYPVTTVGVYDNTFDLNFASQDIFFGA